VWLLGYQTSTALNCDIVDEKRNDQEKENKREGGDEEVEKEE
jgi:hypothetical protein